jgi:hypothetical protein
VLAEQYRLLKAQPQASQPARPAAGAAAWPPSTAPATVPARLASPARPRGATPAPAFALYQTKRRAGFWRRFKHTLLGTPEPVLEDSL